MNTEQIHFARRVRKLISGLSDTEWLVGAGYCNYEGAIAIPEFELHKGGDYNPTGNQRLRVFSNVRYEDFHRPQTHPILKPVLPWELLVGQKYYFVPSDDD